MGSTVVLAIEVVPRISHKQKQQVVCDQQNSAWNKWLRVQYTGYIEYGLLETKRPDNSTGIGDCMEGYIADWLNLLFRWFHLITGAAWIGTSFYFNWLNHNIRPPKEERKGISGELFAVHGGHFYQVSKYAGAPEKLPETLHWFKWEAYFTWITGISLLVVVYYWNASLYLIDPSIRELETWQAIAISLGSLGGGWVVYDQLCKSSLAKNTTVFATVGFVLLTAAAFGLTNVFSPRAAYIHMGAMMGTMMAANVFFVIIPNQRKMVDAMIAGEEPDTSLGDAGSLRSFHNNYFTLPVLFIMVSNHFPMTYGHALNWAILAGISVAGAIIRHHFNLKSKGHLNVWILPIASVMILALAFVMRPSTPTNTEVVASISYADVEPIIKARCQTCHASQPTFTGMTAPPLGVVYDTPEQVQALSAKIKLMAVDSATMPPANITKITEEERAILGQWIDSGSPL